LRAFIEDLFKSPVILALKLFKILLDEVESEYAELEVL